MFTGLKLNGYSPITPQSLSGVARKDNDDSIMVSRIESSNGKVVLRIQPRNHIEKGHMVLVSGLVITE